ncbi:MAG: NAD-dependent epimerase/dehydratase family protein [Solirubrobacteraceae bacterium]
MSRRILVAGLARPLGAQLARALEADPQVEAIVGVDEHDPPIVLERTEFVRVGADAEALRRVMRAARIDTVVDARLVTDAGGVDARLRRRANVTETEVLLSALTSAGVRGLVVAGSAHVYGCGAGDPAYFEEDMVLPAGGTELQRELRTAEATAAELRHRVPGARVAVLRLVDVADETSLGRLLAMPGVIPAVAGFDPRLQVLHPDDAVAAIEHATLERLDGVYNVAADGVLTLSELASLLDRRPAPVLPPWGANLAALPLRRAGLPLPVELVTLLRHGRAVDNRRLKATGLRLRFTTREAALEMRRGQRVAPLVATERNYRYDERLEEFLRRSPAVHASGRIAAVDDDGSGS